MIEKNVVHRLKNNSIHNQQSTVPDCLDDSRCSSFFYVHIHIPRFRQNIGK